MIKIRESKTYYSWSIYDNIGIDYIPDTDFSQYVRIDYIQVDPSERGLGKARQLLRDCLKEIKNKTELPIYIVALELEKVTDLSRLVNFYKNEGFEIVSIIGDSVLMKY